MRLLQRSGRYIVTGDDFTAGYVRIFIGPDGLYFGRQKSSPTEQPWHVHHAGLLLTNALDVLIPGWLIYLCTPTLDPAKPIILQAKFQMVDDLCVKDDFYTNLGIMGFIRGIGPNQRLGWSLIYEVLK
jgi:hypothetical protein